jgi:hypothetical protein
MTVEAGGFVPVPRIEAMGVHFRSVEPMGEARQGVPSPVRVHGQPRREVIEQRRIGENAADDPADEIGVSQPWTVEPDVVPDEPNGQRDPD